MKGREIDNPEGEAEGLCHGLPYDTALVNSNGVNVHFWLGAKTTATMTLLPKAVRTMRNHRDVVSVTYSEGQPIKFWAHQNIGGPDGD